MGKPVALDWLSDLSFKQQTVLLSALRGCDTADKYDLSKTFIRKLRGTIIHDACPSGGDFMEDNVSSDDIYLFTKSLDKYPFHFLIHFIHACEIVGYFHPDARVREWWRNLYYTFVAAFHMSPESKEDCNYRLRDGVETICHKS